MLEMTVYFSIIIVSAVVLSISLVRVVKSSNRSAAVSKNQENKETE